jgi:hypothetical protein
MQALRIRARTENLDAENAHVAGRDEDRIHVGDDDRGHGFERFDRAVAQTGILAGEQSHQTLSGGLADADERGENRNANALLRLRGDGTAELTSGFGIARETPRRRAPLLRVRALQIAEQLLDRSITVVGDPLRRAGPFDERH